MQIEAMGHKLTWDESTGEVFPTEWKNPIAVEFTKEAAISAAEAYIRANPGQF